MRLIDADAIKEDIDKSIFDADDKEWYLTLLANAPTIEPKHGEWIAYKGMQPPEFHGKHYCSNCYHTIHLALNGKVYNFCPNCGADMRERGGENDE